MPEGTLTTEETVEADGRPKTVVVTTETTRSGSRVWWEETSAGVGRRGKWRGSENTPRRLPGRSMDGPGRQAQ